LTLSADLGAEEGTNISASEGRQTPILQSPILGFITTVSPGTLWDCRGRALHFI